MLKKKNGNKYLIFDFFDENKEVLKKYADVWDGIKNKIKAINGDKENDYGKDYMKIKLNSEDDLPLNKLLKLRLMTIIIRCVFSKDGKFYPQLFFRWHFEWIIKMLQYEKNVSEGIDLNKTSASKDIGFKFEGHVWCHNLLTMAYSLENIATLSAKGATYRCLLMGISKNEALENINNSVIYDIGVL